MPTLIFTECVLAYITEDGINNILNFFTNQFKNFAFIDYEMFNGSDKFGKMMVKNFKARGAPLVGIEFFSSLDSIKQKYASKGYSEFEIKDMLQFMRTSLKQEELQR